MNILADYHHAGAARAQVLLLHYRLGHKLYFMGPHLIEELGVSTSIILPVIPSWLMGMGGVPPEILEPDGSWPWIVDSKEELNAIDWGAFLVTRWETQDVFKALRQGHEKIIGVTGNDATQFEWDFVKNLLSSDYLTWVLAPDGVHKLHYSQEIGTQYTGWYPIQPENLKNVASYVNCWPTFTGDWVWPRETFGPEGRCPHCENTPSTLGPVISPYATWKDAQPLLPEHTFNEYGIECALGCKPEVQLPVEYRRNSITVHMKTYDGYGFSMLQSIACGRPVIVPRHFHKYRTANKYLIPNLTCFEVDWTAESVAEAIAYYTGNLARANAYAHACYKAGKALFDWDLEAMRVAEFMEDLI